MSVDLRLFEYRLEPVLVMARWKLDAARARLGKATRDVVEAEDALGALRAAHQAQCRCAAVAAERLDPTCYPRVLSWLAESRRRIEAGVVRVAELEAERRRGLVECTRLHHEVEALERHRKDAQDEFMIAEHSRVLREADRDWLAREELA